MNQLTAALGLITVLLYIFVYTPLKKITWLNTSIGAIPGALPPVGGWTAASGQLEPESWILFGIFIFSTLVFGIIKSNTEYVFFAEDKANSLEIEILAKGNLSPQNQKVI